MSDLESLTVPRAPLRAVVAVWAGALVIGIVIAVFTTVATASLWYALAGGFLLTATFAVQLAFGRSRGFIQRVAASLVGALIVLGFVSMIDALIGLLRP